MPDFYSSNRVQAQNQNDFVGNEIAHLSFEDGKWESEWYRKFFVCNLHVHNLKLRYACKLN